MGKAILVIDMPYNCIECKLRHLHTCPYENKDVVGYYELSFRPGWCPLKEMPEKKKEVYEIECKNDNGEYEVTSIEPIKTAIGWNECIDYIVGGNE